MSSKINIKSILSWTGRATVVHFVTYLIFGIIFFNVFGYATLYSLPDVATFLRPTTDPIVMAGPVFQLIRGPIIGLALYPIRKVFLNEKRGWTLLWGLMLALMIFAPAGSAPGSIEGLIYTKIPLWSMQFPSRNNSPNPSLLVAAGHVANTYREEKAIDK